MCQEIVSVLVFILFASNFLLWGIAAIFLGLTIWVLVAQPSFVQVLSQVDVDIPIYTSAVIVILVVSILTLIITFFGCCGAAKRSRCMLATYFIFILVIFLGMVTGSILVWKGDMSKLQEPFYKSLERFDDQSQQNTDKALVQAWNTLQRDFACCGVENWDDWKSRNKLFSSYLPPENVMNMWTKSPREPMPSVRRVVPESCCDPNNNVKLCSETGLSSYGLRAMGCFKKVVVEINRHSNVIGGVAIGIVVLTVVNGIIALYLCTCGYSDLVDKPRRRGYGPTSTRER